MNLQEKYKKGGFVHHWHEKECEDLNKPPKVLWEYKDAVGDKLYLYNDGHLTIKYDKEAELKRADLCLRGVSYNSAEIVKKRLVNPLCVNGKRKYSIGLEIDRGLNKGVYTIWELGDPSILNKYIRTVREVVSKRRLNRVRMDKYAEPFIIRQNRKIMDEIFQNTISPPFGTCVDIRNPFITSVQGRHLCIGRGWLTSSELRWKTVQYGVDMVATIIATKGNIAAVLMRRAASHVVEGHVYYLRVSTNESIHMWDDWCFQFMTIKDGELKDPLSPEINADLIKEFR